MHEEITKSLDILKSGGTLVYPTDTIWGIGCDATNESAVEKVFALKQRQDSKSLIILLDDALKIPDYVKNVPEMAWDLIDLATTPLTVIFEGAKNLAKNVIAEDGSVAIRITTDPFCKELIKRFKKPITSTSANISGTPSPACFADINESILKQADYVVNLRRMEMSNAKPSSIIKIFENNRFEIIRK